MSEERDYPEDVHWHLIVRNLRQAGMTYGQIAEETGFMPKALQEMESEVYYPPYLSIIKLLDLHITKCPSKHLKVGIINPEGEPWNES
jgi:lambda repressor-like predicted transcriptional regulator